MWLVKCDGGVIASFNTEEEAINVKRILNAKYQTNEYYVEIWRNN